MRVAYICHHGRPNYEQTWFAAMPVEKIKFITTAEPANPIIDPKVEYCVVPFEEKGWENKFFSSTAKRVFYADFEKYLADVDVVVVLELFSSLSRQFVAYCHKVNKPVVVLVYELIVEHPLYKIPRYRGNTKQVLKGADKFLAVSHEAGKHLEKLGARPEAIQVVYPGVNMQLFKADRSDRIDQSLMYVGRLELHKGIDMMIELYRRLVVDMPDLKLTIAGAGSWEPQVAALIEEYPNVTFAKQVPNKELPALLNKHGVYVMPARDTKRLGIRIGAEQFGFSIVEAMACGLAAVTTDCGALAEIVTDKNIVVKQNDIDAMYTQTKALLMDPSRLTELSIYNEQLVTERYDLNTQAAAFVDALDTVVREKRNA